MTGCIPLVVTAKDFPPGTPLNHFFAWNEAAWRTDRRYKLARNPDRLPASPAGNRLAEHLAAAIGTPVREVEVVRDGAREV